MDNIDDFIYPGMRPPERVVSLVPSITESLFDLGFGESVVGITNYCSQPAGHVEMVPKVGGPKDASLEAILMLRPDLVIANREENSKDLVEALEQAGITVWVTFPRTVNQALEMLEKMASIYHNQSALNQIRPIQMAVDWARSAAPGLAPIRYFCPIWQEAGANGDLRWITFTDDTYLANLLSLFGGVNVFGQFVPYQGPGEDRVMGTSIRYPLVKEGDVLAADPDLILLPDEPFRFDGSHCQEFKNRFPGIKAAIEDRIRLVDGSLISWYGTRVAKAIECLPLVFE